jgi:hypothetical protein
MYYFGTNLDARFQVRDFWPTQSQSHKIPSEPEERMELLNMLRERRERVTRERLEEAKRMRGPGGEAMTSTEEPDYARRIGDGMERRMGAREEGSRFER